MNKSAKVAGLYILATAICLCPMLAHLAEAGPSIVWSGVRYIQTTMFDTGFTYHGWAYETQPGFGITLGMVPEPSTWGLLLVGLGCLFWTGETSVKSGWRHYLNVRTD